MVPNLRNNYDSREQLMGNDAEITDPDLLTGKRFVEPPVDEIGDSEKKVLGSLFSLGENYAFSISALILFN